MQFGYSLDENGQLMPEIINEPALPEDFSVPCNSLKCAGPMCVRVELATSLASNFANVKLKNYVKTQIKVCTCHFTLLVQNFLGMHF